MGVFRLEITKPALRVLRRSPANVARLIRAKLDELADDPTALRRNVKPLRGRPGYRLRVGDWRVIFEIDVQERRLIVLDIGPRGDILTDEPLVLKHDGKPAYVVVRYDLWRDLLAQVEETDEVRAYDRAKARADQEAVPIAIADALLAGQNPIRVWREYRGLTQEQLANAAAIRRAYVAQLEAGRRRGSTAVLARIAVTLGVDIEDLI
jgi:mRNA-degrading endonuclease RelE of RelBE toxin-antitoxin system/DNA-binding XRE family transcriptional regulator